MGVWPGVPRVDSSGRYVDLSRAVVTCSPNFSRGAVVEAGVRAAVVAVEVGDDLRSYLVEGLELGAPARPFFPFPEPALDEVPALGVTVAAAAVRDTARCEPLTEAAGGGAGAVAIGGVLRCRSDEPITLVDSAVAARTTERLRLHRPRDSRLGLSELRCQRAELGPAGTST